VNYVNAGYMGVKSGKGFYEYKAKKWWISSYELSAYEDDLFDIYYST
jgi:3-hydroxyacyl-CoA dehydrogenase